MKKFRFVFVLPEKNPEVEGKFMMFNLSRVKPEANPESGMEAAK